MYTISTMHIFIFLFIMLGPLHLLGPFTKATHELDSSEIRELSLSSSVIAIVCIFVAGFLGTFMIKMWDLQVPIVLLAGGIILFLTALRPLISSSTESNENLPIQTPGPGIVALKLIITPYGVATVIVLMASSRDLPRTATILSILLVIMVLNALAMVYGKSILKGVGGTVLPILGTILGVLQFALALEIMYRSILLLVP